ncbi:C40 family peptidase [Alysiella crassa]|uniref:NlpC/P60 family n=1 Tax=Alysiella crassa TaxID=153491 RepID=A0A376BU44_9NEIS|nr:C40 family peptidase [Alysiella crassa]UOP05867.1 C40 family peptidase [Alysiella crassa]SSY80295.1 NlpC/P60 family [Alysiella crassa]
MNLNSLTQETQESILKIAEKSKPHEMCGFIVCNKTGYSFFLCFNVATNPAETFDISVDDVIRANAIGEVVAVVHSHPNGEPFLSGADRQAQVATDLPWILASSGSLKLFQPVPHLRGREFIYDKSDCCRLIQDAYHLCGLDLPDCERLGLDEDIEAQTLLNYFQYNHEFNQVYDWQAGDIILTQSGKHTPEHALLYLGNGEILHHAHNHLSRLDFYSDYWQKHTHSVWRHQKWQPEMMAAIFADLLHSN